MAGSKNSASTSSGGRITGWLRFFAIIFGVLSVYWVLDMFGENFFIFHPTQLHDLQTRALAAHGNDTRSVVKFIVDELRADTKLSPYISNEEEWIFNNAGGAMGGMYLIHASITEYLIIFGSAVGTEGHTGRHTADDYFHILQGEQWAYKAGEYEREVYPQGSVHHLIRGEVKQYKMPESCFAMEYVRGWVPPMLLFGYADGLSSTLDFPTLWRQTYVTGREMIGNLIRFKL